jgi:hypothetical protein
MRELGIKSSMQEFAKPTGTLYDSCKGFRLLPQQMTRSEILRSAPSSKMLSRCAAFTQITSSRSAISRCPCQLNKHFASNSSPIFRRIHQCMLSSWFSGLAHSGFDRLDHSGSCAFASEKKAPPEEKIPRHGIENRPIYSDYVGAPRVKRTNPLTAGFLASRHPDEEKQKQTTRRTLIHD